MKITDIFHINAVYYTWYNIRFYLILDGSLLYERVPNKQEAAAALNNPSVTPAAVGLNSAILGVLGSTGSAGSGGMGASGLSNDQTATGFDVTTAIYQQQQQSSSSSGSNKRRLYETDGGKCGNFVI